MTSSKNNSQLKTQENINNTLLPTGFYDLLFLEAKKNHQNINQILEGFFAKNFNLKKISAMTKIFLRLPIFVFEVSIIFPLRD